MDLDIEIPGRSAYFVQSLGIDVDKKQVALFTGQFDGNGSPDSGCCPCNNCIFAGQPSHGLLLFLGKTWVAEELLAGTEPLGPLQPLKQALCGLSAPENPGNYPLPSAGRFATIPRSNDSLDLEF